MRIEDINSIESESGVIATLLHHPEYIYYSEDLLPNHFTNKDNRCVYTAVESLVKKEIYTADPYNILQELSSSEATRSFSESLTLEKLQELEEMSDVLCRNSIEEYKLLADNVLRAAFRRELFADLKECEQRVLKYDADDIGRMVYDILDATISGYTRSEEIPEFGERVDCLWHDIESHQNGFCGIPFFIEALNDYVTMEKGELVVVAAPQKGGKSMFMLDSAVHALRLGETVMYIDSELSDRLFLCRMVAYLTGIDFNAVKNGRYSEEEYGMIQEAIAWIKSQRFVHLYMPVFDQAELYLAVKKIYNRYDGLGLLIVDYIKSSGDADAFATYQELGKLTDLIKNDICGALNIPGLAAAQLTDGGALADSKKIGRNASTILIITDKTAEEVETDGPECGTKKLFVRFNRNGMQMAQGEYIDLEFNGNKIDFRQAKQHIPQSPY